MHNRKADILFEEEELWKAVPDRDRRDLYEDVVFFLAKKEKEESKALRKRNIEAMNAILDSMPNVTFRTTWTECQQHLMENPTFAEDEELMSEYLATGRKIDCRLAWFIDWWDWWA